MVKFLLSFLLASQLYLQPVRDEALRETVPAPPDGAPTIQFTSPGYSDNENVGTSTMIKLSRVGDVSGSSEVTVNVTGGTAIAPGDFTTTSFPLTVTFVADDIEETVSLPVINDSTQEDTETIIFEVVSVTNAAIGANSTTTFTIVDNDSPPDVAFSSSDNYQAVEDVGTSTVLTLTRVGDLTATSEVLVTITGGTATAPGDYTNTSFPISVVFGISDTSATVSVPIINDTDVESTETILFSVTATDNATIIAPTTATLEIVDNDTVMLPLNDISGETNHQTNGNLSGTTGWAIENAAVYDATVTRTADGSGSVKISTDSTADKAWSPIIDISGESAGYFQYGFFVRSDTLPQRYGAQLSHYNSSSVFQFNDNGFARGDVGTPNVWHETAQIRYIDTAVTPKVRIQVFGREQAGVPGNRWFDDFYLVKLADPPVPLFTVAPPTKTTFSSSEWQIDELGNMRYYDGAAWQNFFLFAMHPNSGRTNYDVYFNNGFNTVVWTNTDAQLQTAVNAGMRGMLQVSSYVSPIGSQYNDTTTLNSRLDAMIASGNISSLLGWWWDHEDMHNEWDVPRNMIAAMRAKAPGKPVISLDGNYNRISAYGEVGLVDVFGAYSSEIVDHIGSETTNMATTARGNITLSLPSNPVPGTVQIVSGLGGHAGNYRLSVYNNVIRGARGIIFYSDGLTGDPNFEDYEWFTDAENVENEIDTLLPIIREPHWTTSWGATSSTTNVRVHTREKGTRKFVWLVNQTSSSQAVTVTLTGTPVFGNGDDVVDYFTSVKVTDLNATPAFTVTLPAIGVVSGTAVYELITDGGADPIDYTVQALFGDEDTAPLTDPYVAEVSNFDVVQTATPTLSMTGGELVVPEPTANIGWANHGVISVGTYNRDYGQIFKTKVNFSHVDSCVFGPALLSTVDQNTIGAFRIETSDIYYAVGGSIFIIDPTNLATATDYELMATYDNQSFERSAVLIKGGVFTDWTLLGCFHTSTNVTTRAMFANFDAAVDIDYILVPQTSSVSYFPAPLLNDTYAGVDTTTLRSSNGLASGNSAGAGVVYTESVGDFEHDTNRLESVGAVTSIVTTDSGLTDGFFEFTMQAPSGGVHGFVYRYVDSSNYWVAGLDVADGDIKLVKVTAGTPTVEATITDSVAADTDVTIRGSYKGSVHRIFKGTSTATVTDTAHAAGTTVGLKSAGVDAVQFDDVLLWSLSPTDVPVLP